MESKRYDEIILNIYRKLYENSTPKGNFDKLLEEATINEFGQKDIKFMDYEISQEEYVKIVDDNIPKSLSKFRKDQIKSCIALGCSPKFKK